MSLKRRPSPVAMPAQAIFGRIKDYRRFSQMHATLQRFQGSEVAQQRLKIIQFYDEYGEAATHQAFGVNRQTVWNWKRRLERAHGQLAALTPHSTRPQHVRRMTTDPQLIAFIRALRAEHPHLGKAKLKPLLDEYCRGQGLRSLAEATIGKLLQRLPSDPPAGRVYHSPETAARQAKIKRAGSRPRVRYAPQPAEWGHLELDTMERLVDGLKLYFYSGIDVRGKFSLALPYSQRNSHNSVDFLQKFQQVYPLPIRVVQTDNGSEFLGEFEDYLRQIQIRHLFTDPRCPRINGCIERYQRTLQEEFVNLYEGLVRYPQLFLNKLVEYLIFYNNRRPHQALHFQTPLAFLVAEQALSNMSVSRTVH